MSYIAPNSTIKFLSGVPLDNTFEHTLYFTSAAIQATILSGYASYTLDAQSYVREESGSIRVSLSTTQLYACNYIMFKNTSFENKWFYAFITGIRYRSNGTSIVEFQLDPIQTWLFDFTVEASFVEREHAATDVAGDNLVPENLETGELISNGWTEMIPQMSGLTAPNMKIVFGCTFGYDPSGGTPAARFPDYYGGANNGIFSGLALHAFDSVSAAVAFVTQVVTDKKLSGIVCCFMMSAEFWSAASTSLMPSLTARSVSIGSKPTTIPGLPSGYTIKNKKLLTAPYIQLYVTNNQGNGAAYPYEYFDGSSVSFDLWGSCSPDPAVIAVPVNYKGISGDNWDEKIMLKGFPVCSFNVDSFKAWLAQSGSALAVSNMSSSMSSMVNMASGNYVAGGMGLINTIASSVQQVYQHSIMPPQSHGNVSGNVLYSAGILNLHYTVKHIRPEFVYIIDDYFNRFGYATHRVKVPNVFTNFGNRPHWCFMQTKKCGLKGNIPADDMRNLQNIFDAGITWWKVAAEVGHYEYNNAPSAPTPTDPTPTEPADPTPTEPATEPAEP